jgi:hypothetical protein
MKGEREKKEKEKQKSKQKNNRYHPTQPVSKILFT